MKPIFSLPFLAISATATAIAALPGVGPDYVRPAISTPANYREAATDVAWKTAEPADNAIRGEWWKLFADPVLDDLETRALAANQDLRAAAARVDQARAAAGFARSAGWPQLALNPSLSRERTSATTDNVFPTTQSTTYRAPLIASWEIDLFGRVRRLSESARADAEASAATFESVRLSLTGEVAGNYFSYRAAERELGLVRDTVALRRRALDLISARFRSGSAAEFDVVRAETELATAEAESASLANRHAALRHALAVLVGEPASTFSLAAATHPSTVNPPDVPRGLPAELLERRPDIAAAERALASANARIGVAKAAFFPAISLTGSAGFASGDVDRLFTSDSRAWSIGPSLYLPIFQGGRNRANLERSRAAYDESVALFRQQVLVAFREVQDALTATQFLAEQSAAQDRALASARRATALAQTRYDAGFVSYLEVIDAQRTSLAVERTSAQLAALRLNNSVALIKALGGGWKNAATVQTVAQK
ncbi:MAG TPA: efflux transporter outer membrane subunit [Opitutaceae bacterium]|nr:efflux transporter outer membrane subunit [Opitutaceae bacterium]